MSKFRSVSGFLKTRKYVHFDLVFLSALTLIFFFFNIWTGSLRDWDEAIYAQVAKEYFQRSDWLTPTFNGELWFHKPPFVMWFMALGYSIWGVGEWATRLGPAIAGTVSIFVTYRFTKEFIGKKVAFLAALILLGIPHYVSHAKMGMLDIPLTLFILLSIFFYLRGASKPHWFLAAGAAFGIGFMIKGVAVCFVPLMVLMHMAACRDFKPLRSIYFWAGIGIAFTIFGPWHIFQYLRHGSDFWKEYFLYHVISRGASAIEGHPNDIFYYFRVLTKEARPWILPGFLAIPYCAMVSWKERNRFISLLVCWICSVFIITALFSTKLDWYIMPIYPALSICIAIMLLRLIRDVHFKKLAAAAFVIIILNGTFCHKIFDLDYSSEIKALAHNVSLEVPSNETLYLYKLNGPAARFYNDLSMIMLNPDDANIFNTQISRHDHIYVLTRTRDIEQLQALTFTKSTKIIASQNKHILAKLRIR